MSEMTMLLFLCPVIFLASFVDAIAGGGGLLSLPAFIFTGIPVHNAYGCNKFSCCVSTLVSTARFLKHGILDLKIALFAGAVTFVCSTLASQLVLLLPDHFLKGMVVVSMPVIAVLILMQRSYPEENHIADLTKSRLFAGCILVGTVMGLYDGMLGPGSGTLAIVLGCHFLKYDLKTASGNAKALVLASTFAAALSYLLAGMVIWRITIPATLFGLAGSYLGSGFAIRKGAKFIRPMMLVIAMVLIIKMALEMVI